MADRSLLTLSIVVVIFFVVLAILGILVWRHGRTTETKAILDAIQHARAQTDVHEQVVEGRLRAIGNWLRQIVTRLGFLADSNQREPPVQPKAPPKDDIQ